MCKINPLWLLCWAHIINYLLQSKEAKQKSNMKPATNNPAKFNKQQLICEQIDIVIMGSKAFELLQILLDRNLKLVPMPTLKNKYLNTLSSLVPPYSHLQFQPTMKFPANMPQNKIQIYTTNILTQSFWLQFNFFYLGALCHDPLLGPISRHKTPLCIIASSQEQADNPTLKQLLSSTHPNSPHSQPSSSSSSSNPDHKAPSRLQVLMQQKIINLLHNFKLNEFTSILSLKFIDKNRIIEGSSGFKLGRNQILRWIVDRYFQYQFSVKLAGEVGDQIQNYQEVQESHVCGIM